jgi:Ca2+-binding EF-hand superfamily protein
MGAKGGKQQKPNSQFNFTQYGLSPDEAGYLQTSFNQSAGKDKKLDHNEFMKLYLQLNPSGQQNPNELANRAFIAADTNRDGSITIEEFIAFYIMNKSQSHNINNNMSNFLQDQNNGNNGFITPDQANYYANFAYNYYGGPANVPLPGQMIQSFDSYNGQIPINAFVEQISPYYSQYY